MAIDMLPFGEPEPDPYRRQKAYRDKMRAEGVCVACFEMFVAENPKTGKPYWKCQRCRLQSAAIYLETGKQF